MATKTTKGTFVKLVMVIDPDTGNEVGVEIYKLEGGGMVGIDSSYVETLETIYSPFDKGIEVDID